MVECTLELRLKSYLSESFADVEMVMRYPTKSIFGRDKTGRIVFKLERLAPVQAIKSRIEEEGGVDEYMIHVIGKILKKVDSEVKSSQFLNKYDRSKTTMQLSESQIKALKRYKS